MTGLELSREFFRTAGEPMLRELFPEERHLIAAGLAGQGSECFGFDDELSRDHDFGVDFCLWIPDELADTLGPRLQDAYFRLPRPDGAQVDSYVTPERARRIGVHTIGGFFRQHIGRSDAPTDPMDWIRIPERYLAEAVNGEVFSDPLGELTAIRRALLDFYPEDVAKKKLAADCAVMAQAGQYNYPRALQRRDFGSAYLACGEFVRAALAALYLLNGRYMPFYKWAFRGTQSFLLGTDCAQSIRTLALTPDLTAGKEKTDRIEEICAFVAGELVRRGWSDEGDSFMQYHAQRLMERIDHPGLRQMYIMAGGI